jgi:hypothetical protein
MENQDLIKKADLALSDLSNNGGLLNPEQTDTFIRTLIDSPTIINACRTVTMSAPTRKINKIGFGSRILHPADQSGGAEDSGANGRHLAAAKRSKADISQIELNTKEVMAEVHIPYEVLEDNIEGGNINAGATGSPGGLHSTLVQMIAERAALDMEELLLLGDTQSGDPYLALLDGWLKRSTAHVVNAGGATINKDVFKAGIKAMPDKYLRNRASLVQFVSVDNETEYRDTYAGRQTSLGDTMLQGANDLRVFGTGIQAVPLMPESKGLFTNPLNLILGIQRRITMEYDKDIRARTFIIVLTARIANQIEETDAVVSYTNIAS